MSKTVYEYLGQPSTRSGTIALALCDKEIRSRKDDAYSQLAKVRYEKEDVLEHR